MVAETNTQKMILKYRILRKLAYALIFIVLIAVILFPAWFFGGKAILSFKPSIEEMPVSANRMGNYFFSMKQFDEALDQYKSAVWQEKYLVLWNDNADLPVYYNNLGRAYMNLDQPKKAVEQIENGLALLKIQTPENVADIAFANFQAGFLYSQTGEHSREMERLLSAMEYYDSLPAESQGKNAGSVNLFLAHCYYEEGDFGNAIARFEKGIPLYYDSIIWGIGDDGDNLFMAVCYKFAALAYEKAGNAEYAEKYLKKFNDIVLLRDISDAQLEECTSYYGWRY